jgi:hypothetical protein
MTPRYFQGESVYGQVQASTAQNFAEVVAKLNVCPQLPLSRKAFLALPKPVRQEKKHVPFFVAATFKSTPSARRLEHASECNLIFLDLDEIEETGKCPAAPFVNNPETLYTALEGFNFAAHTTASSTAEKPRMRIIVEADGLPLESYPHAARTIGALLGLPTLTPESERAVLPMFLPTQFKDDTEEQHPLIAYRTDARAFTAQDIAGNLPAQPKKERHDNSDDLDFLRAPVQEVTLAVAKEALSFVNPDCSYAEWLEIAASLRHQFSPEQAEEGYEIFDEWSSQGSKYGGGDETRAKWDSLRPTPVGRAPVTIRSLLKRAAVGGWDDSTFKNKGYDALVHWMEHVGSVTQLMEGGIRKILATPQISSVQEGMLMDQLRVRAKERFGYRASITDLRKDLGKLREKMEAQQAPKVEKKEPKWAKGLCFVSTSKEFYRTLTGEKYKPDSFDLKYGRYLLPTKKDLTDAGVPVNDTTMSRPLVKPTDYVLNVLQVPTFYDFAYAPEQPNEMVFVYEKRKYVNTYSPTYPELDTKNENQAGELFQKHLSNLVSEPEYRQTLTDFMAYQVQFPGKKIRWAVLVQGAEGAGKTYLAEVMKAVLGKRHVKTVDGTTISSGWNEWTFGYQMVVIEEVRVVGTNRHDIMNRLKPWITNEDIPINEKFRSSRDAQNITNYMLFSNHQDSLALTPGDRRYYVVKSPLQQKSQVLALGKDYFTELFDFLNHHPGAMRAWLLNWKLSEDFNPNAQAPRTKYVEEMIADSANDLTAAVRRLMLEGDVPLIQYDIVGITTLERTLNMEEGLGKVTKQQLARCLREEGLELKGRHMIAGGERENLWARPGVKDAATDASDRVKHGKKNLCMELIYS